MHEIHGGLCFGLNANSKTMTTLWHSSFSHKHSPNSQLALPHAPSCRTWPSVEGIDRQIDN